MQRLTNLLLLFFFGLILASSFTFDLSQVDKHGNILRGAPCNKDTIIDFSFSSDTVISNCSPSGCTLTNPGSSTLTFLNVAGVQQTYTLKNATAAITPGGVSRAEEAGIFEFGFQTGGQWVMVAVPFSTNISNSLTPQTYELNLAKSTDPSLNILSSTTNQLTNSTGIPLSAFNFLNQLNYGIFYQVADSKTTVTYLLSYFILANLKIPLASLPTLSTPFPPSGINYQMTGDKLCYGSVSEGVVNFSLTKFQTHLRQSYPLWTAWFGIFIYWMFYMFAELTTISCYEQRFRNNKWTCWSMFSLHHLGNEEYFTKLSRSTMMLITFSWEALICAVLYSNTSYGQKPIEILWVGAVAFATALPFSYVLGYFFLTKIYEKNLHKFQVMKQMHGHFNKKEGIDKFETQLDDIQETLYGLYYWYYVIAFIFFVSFWIIAVHQMMQVPWYFYYLHRYWLASLGIAFGLEYLVLDPLMSLIFGNFRFYQIRGFWYDYRLGEKFKELEE